MKARDLVKLGIPSGELTRLAMRLLGPAFAAGKSQKQLVQTLQALAEDPAAYREDPDFGELAVALLVQPPAPEPFVERDAPAPWRSWGRDLDPKAVGQLRDACRLPVAVAGALMPDAHLGYGLPIGGVLACEKAVIPYAVGVDIACRMKITVLDLPEDTLRGQADRLAGAIEEETRFGVGSSFQKPRDHEVMDEDWNMLPLTRNLKQKARVQLGSSGSGNHFVEFGELVLDREELGLAPGRYLALLSHSGSRGPGSAIANHYSKLAMELHPGLPKELQHLAWLDLESEPGQEYWAAMELMGRYAAANHAVIHREILRHLGSKSLLSIENHHNFAWKEMHQGREVIVHRKGATPAGEGVLGVIPGSMASPAFVVRGKGSEDAIQSASHGAGRVMSRKQAQKSFTWSAVRKLLADQGVRLLSAGIDEVPGVYKDIESVMADQVDLVDSLARFHPRLVKMAPPKKRR